MTPSWLGGSAEKEEGVGNDIGAVTPSTGVQVAATAGGGAGVGYVDQTSLEVAVTGLAAGCGATVPVELDAPSGPEMEEGS